AASVNERSFGVFKAIGRYIRAFGYLITGRVDSARKELQTNPYVVQATYANIIEEKTARIHQYKDAVAGLIAQEEKKLASVRTLTADVERLEQLKEGAAAKARQLVASMQAEGKSMEQIKTHDDYRQCLTAFNDFTSTLAEKNARIEELEADVHQITESVSGHKVQLTQLKREIDKLKEEQHEAVADIITAKEEEELADMISGISQDTTNKELQELRDVRQQVKAKARISREMAGTDTARQEAEFMEFARTHSANDEFDALIGLAESADTTPIKDAPAPDARLPE
ncbi:MAG: PspA/IM30 family protein, partial [Phycisphaerales bacterium]